MKKYNYIIVGQGIAGTVLAQTFLKAGKSVLVIDEQSLSQSSRIAAGNFNPIVLKRLVKSWMADELIPFADSFYKDAETLLGQNFYSKKEVVKIFGEEQEKDFWLKRSNNIETGSYLSKEFQLDFFSDVVHNPYGVGIVTDAMNLYVSKFLADFRNYFIENDLLINEQFDFKFFKINHDSVHYKEVIADKIIFCEGYKVAENPYFNWLPFKPAKGELLTVKIKNLPTDKIINKGVYMLPIGEDLFIVGATYDWQNLNDLPTEKARIEISEKLAKVIKVPFEIVNHQAGVRPSVFDRRPILGLHPDYKSIGIFNGMGTKGVMLAPYFAKQLFDFLENNFPLNAEVDIKRVVKNAAQ